MQLVVKVFEQVKNCVSDPRLRNTAIAYSIGVYLLAATWLVALPMDRVAASFAHS
jgi:hypothetical protein